MLSCAVGFGDNYAGVPNPSQQKLDGAPEKALPKTSTTQPAHYASAKQLRAEIQRGRTKTGEYKHHRPAGPPGTDGKDIYHPAVRFRTRPVGWFANIGLNGKERSQNQAGKRALAQLGAWRHACGKEKSMLAHVLWRLTNWLSRGWLEAGSWLVLAAQKPGLLPHGVSDFRIDPTRSRKSRP